MPRRRKTSWQTYDDETSSWDDTRDWLESLQRNEFSYGGHDLASSAVRQGLIRSLRAANVGRRFARGAYPVVSAVEGAKEFVMAYAMIDASYHEATGEHIHDSWHTLGRALDWSWWNVPVHIVYGLPLMWEFFTNAADAFDLQYNLLTGEWTGKGVSSAK